jgi:N-acetylmuramoyl-L-alanine amidase
MRPKLILILFSLLISASVSSQEESIGKIKKIVIDAGHGGKDPGALSRDRRVAEKNITLSVALSLGKMIQENFPDINVIYTRKSDIFIPLDERTAIANRNRADLFISIHVNSARAVEAAGTETFVMGTDKSSSNLEVTKLENSVVVMEDDYSSKYEGFDPDNPESFIIFTLLQNSHLEQSLDLAEYVQRSLTYGPIKKSRGIKQAGFLVLWRATMPSILIELGFISNGNDLKVLSDYDSQKQFAYNIYRAFSEYKNKFEKGIRISSVQSDSESEVKTAKAVFPQQDSEVVKNIHAEAKADPPVNTNEKYMIQLLAATRKISLTSPELKGIKNITCSRIGNFYKYFTGIYPTMEEAMKFLPDIRKKFPQAFIVKESAGEIKPAK